MAASRKKIQDPGEDPITETEKEQETLPKEVLPQGEPELSSEELIEARWILFGRCPVCRRIVKNWSPGPFNAQYYSYLSDNDIDPLSGHLLDCTEKWRKA